MKKSIALVLVLIMVLSLVACAAKEEAAVVETEVEEVVVEDEAPVDDGETYSLMLSTVLADTDPIVQGLEKLAADVLADTNGKVVIEVYPSSQLGDTADVLEQAKAGSNVGCYHRYRYVG